MAIGMTYEQFWDGDACLVKVFREREEILLERQSFQAWLTGRYIYDALIDASPVLNAMSKRKKPLPYTEKPYQLTKRSDRIAKNRELEARQMNGMLAMQRMADAFNKGFKNKKKGGG